jgi:hypothetical protein
MRHIHHYNHHPFRASHHKPAQHDDLSQSMSLGGGNLFYALAESIVFAGVVVAAAPFCLAKTLIDQGIARAKMREMTQKMTAAGLPTPAQVTARFKTRRKKTLTQALELGAMLLAITPTLDASRPHAADGRVRGRASGLKGWLAQYCPTVSYSSASRYRKLAERFLVFLQFDTAQAPWAMSWIMPDKPLPETDDDTLAAVRQTRASVATLLRHYPSQRALHRLMVTLPPPVARPS